MKKSEYLHYLIHSLSKSEKRSFKLFANQYSKEDTSSYILIFDAIDQMDRPNNKLLVEKLKNKIKEGNIPTLKIQLRNMILTSIRKNPSLQNKRIALRESLDFIDILYEKGLYDQCKALIQKTWDKAIEQENFYVLNSLASKKLEIAFKMSDGDEIKHYLSVTGPEVDEFCHKLTIIKTFEFLHAQIRLNMTQSTSAWSAHQVEKLEQIVSHPLLQASPEDLPKKCQLDYHTIWGNYHHSIGNSDEAYYHRKIALEMAEENNVGFRTWLSHARYLLATLSIFKKFDLFDELSAKIMSRIEKIPKSKLNSAASLELLYTIRNVQLNRAIDSYKFTEAALYQKEIEERLEGDIHHVDTNLFMVLCYNISYIHLANQNPKRALFWMNRLMNDDSTKSIRYDVQCYGRVIEIIIHFSLGNYELVESLVPRTKRFMKKHDRYSSLIDVFLKFALEKLTTPYDPKSISIYKSELEKWEKLIEENDSRIVLFYFDIITWLRSLIQQNTMEEAFKNSPIEY